MKNSQVQQPFIPTDGLELYYDVKGKKNTDNYKGTLLDMSGNGRHGVLSNFAYEGVSGFTGTTEGGLLLDDVDDKIVRPAISCIEYTSASRNLFNKNGKLNEKPSTDVSNYDTTTYDSVNDLIVTTGVNGVRYGYGQKISVKRNTNYYCSASAVGVQQRISIRKENSTVSPLADFVITAGGTNGRSFNTGDNDFIFIIPLTESITGTYGIKYLQIEESAVCTAYAPYIPLPIMTYQMNGNILSFEKDGTVKRVTNDVNGNRITVSRKGINLIRNGNFTNEINYWDECDVVRKIDNGSLLIQAKTTNNEHYVAQTMLTVSPNSIYYLSGSIETISGVAHIQTWNRTKDTYENSGGTTHITEGNIYFIEKMITTTAIHDTEPHMFIRLQLLPDIEGNHFLGTNESARFSNIQLINLTEAYGAGNEPTLVYIQANPEEFAWTPNPNDLIETVEIKNNLVGDLENLQGNDFEQHEDGNVTYTNEAEKGSVVRVDIDGISDQPLRFRTAEGQQVVITEHDTTDADAIKKIEFAGESIQLADKYREVGGTSIIIAPELHDKTTADKLVIGGNTTQYTESSNVVTDGLEMWLSGRNFSNSPDTTVWKDLTGVNNGTASGFAYTSSSGSDGNSGVVFDGVDDKVTINTNNLPYGNANRTVEINFTPKNNTGAYRYLFCYGLNSYGKAFSIVIDQLGNKLALSTWGNIIFETAIVSNTNYTVAVVKSGSNVYCYLNGSKVETVSGNTLSTEVSTFATIGASFIDTEQLKDDVKFARIYNRALSDSEVLQNYNAGVAIPIPNIAMPQEVKHVNSGNKVMIHGKNLFDGSKVISTPYGTSTWDGNSLVVTGAYYVQLDIKLKRNTVYCMSAIRTGAGSGSIAIYNGAGQLDTNIASGTENYTFTTRDYDDYAILLYAGMGTAGTKTFSNIQLEEGVNITSYEQFKGYQETTIPVTLKSIG